MANLDSESRVRRTAGSFVFVAVLAAAGTRASDVTDILTVKPPGIRIVNQFDLTRDKGQNVPPEVREMITAFDAALFEMAMDRPMHQVSTPRFVVADEKGREYATTWSPAFEREDRFYVFVQRGYPKATKMSLHGSLEGRNVFTKPVILPSPTDQELSREPAVKTMTCRLARLRWTAKDPKSRAIALRPELLTPMGDDELAVIRHRRSTQLPLNDRMPVFGVVGPGERDCTLSIPNVEAAREVEFEILRFRKSITRRPMKITQVELAERFGQPYLRVPVSITKTAGDIRLTIHRQSPSPRRAPKHPSRQCDLAAEMELMPKTLRREWYEPRPICRVEVISPDIGTLGLERVRIGPSVTFASSKPAGRLAVGPLALSVMTETTRWTLRDRRTVVVPVTRGDLMEIESPNWSPGVRLGGPMPTLGPRFFR